MSGSETATVSQRMGATVMGVATIEGYEIGNAVEAAIRFVAEQPGGARRILLEHHRRDDGQCAGCLTVPVSWPCVVGVIATKALPLESAR
jgi:hypothetical protein